MATKREKIMSRMSDDIIRYILLQHFDKHQCSNCEALAVLGSVVGSIIMGICRMEHEDLNKMVDVFCDSLKKVYNEKDN